jgi:hypothetical protein
MDSISMSKLSPKPDAYATVQFTIPLPDGNLEAFYIPRRLADYIRFELGKKDRVIHEIEKDWWDED